MAIQFPTHTINDGVFYDQNTGQTWKYNGEAWVRMGPPLGVPEAPATKQQYARVNNPDLDVFDKVIGPSWQLVSADIWYLGAYPVAPVRDPFQQPLQEGHTYFDTSTKIMYVWDGTSWDGFSGVSEIATLNEFRWDTFAGGETVLFEATLVGTDPETGDPIYTNAPDDHGNVPSDAWIRGQIILTIYKNGIRLVEQRPTDGILMGTWDPAAGVFPSRDDPNIKKGYYYVAESAGDIQAFSYVPGDIIEAVKDYPSDSAYNSNWVRKVISVSPGNNKGIWDASLSAFPDSSADAINDFYICTVAGTVDSYNYIIGDVIQVITPVASGSYNGNWLRLPEGHELDNDNYGFTADYLERSITLLTPVTEDDLLVLETGTLAASQYIKSTDDDTQGWEFVVDDETFTNPSRVKIPTQWSVAAYLAEQLEVAFHKTERIYENMVGTVFSFGGPVAPEGALSCDGTYVSELVYPLLYQAIGNTWDTFNGGIPSSNPNEFRLPPQSINGEPLFFTGSTASNVGSYLENDTKAHSHTAHHSHTGRADSAGAHSHTISGISSAHDSSGNRRMVDERPEYPDWTKETGSNGAHTHKVTVDQNNVVTSVVGGITNRPDTAVTLTCIWADVQQA